MNITPVNNNRQNFGAKPDPESFHALRQALMKRLKSGETNRFIEQLRMDRDDIINLKFNNTQNVVIKVEIPKKEDDARDFFTVTSELENAQGKGSEKVRIFSFSPFKKYRSGETIASALIDGAYKATDRIADSEEFLSEQMDEFVSTVNKKN